MQLFHTSDWHLGRLLHGASLLEDQAHALDQLCQLAEEHRPDAILIAGDVYDRPVPPATAITLLDQTLDRLIHQIHIPVLLISGNHDSAERLGFASHALSRAGLHMISSLEQILDPVSIHSSNQHTLIWAIPYVDPETVRLFFKQNALLLTPEPPTNSTDSISQNTLATLSEGESLKSDQPDHDKTPAPKLFAASDAAEHTTKATIRQTTQDTANPPSDQPPLSANTLHDAALIDKSSSLSLIKPSNERRLRIASHAQQLQIDPAMIRDHQGAYEAIMAVINAERAERTADAHVLVGHCFAGGALESDSERPLSIGGSDQVEARVFAGFDYVALGHLHRPQQIKSERVRYSGSLMKYSFSEATHTKAVLKVALGAARSLDQRESPDQCSSDLQITPLALTPLKDMQRLSGTFADIFQAAKASPSQDYIQVELSDSGAVYDPMAQLRGYYPNLLNLTRKRLQGASVSEVRQTAPALGALMSETQLFAQFAQQVLAEDLSEEETSVAAALIDQALKQLDQA